MVQTPRTSTCRVRGTKHHIALYVWSDTTLTRLSHLLDNYSTGESTIRFQLDNPLPEAVVHAIVNHRVTEILGSDR